MLRNAYDPPIGAEAVRDIGTIITHILARRGLPRFKLQELRTSVKTA